MNSIWRSQIFKDSFRFGLRIFSHKFFGKLPCLLKGRTRSRLITYYWVFLSSYTFTRVFSLELTARCTLNTRTKHWTTHLIVHNTGILINASWISKFHRYKFSFEVKCEICECLALLWLNLLLLWLTILLVFQCHLWFSFLSPLIVISNPVKNLSFIIFLNNI
jgi:hypothetical protein